MELEKELQLMELLKEGDEDAFTIIYAAYKANLLQFLIRQGVLQEDAEDIVQEVLSSLWKNRATLNVTGSLKGYLIGAVSNKRCTLFRSTQTNTGKHSRYEQSNELKTADAETKQEMCEWLQQELNLVANDLEKAVYEETYINGAKTKDIAAKLDITPYRVRRIVARINDYLRILIKKHQ